MSDTRSPYEVPFRSSQKTRYEPRRPYSRWFLLAYFMFWPFWLIIVPLFMWAHYLRKYWLDAWRDIVEIWGIAYIEIPGDIYRFLKSRMKRRENDKTNHHQ